MKRITTVPGLPKAVGPYSLATIANGVIYTAGQLPLDQDGVLHNGSIETETRQIMENLKTLLAAADSSLDNVMQTTIYITAAEHFAEVNRVYGSYFAEGQAPARTTVIAQPPIAGANVEISMIAAITKAA